MKKVPFLLLGLMLVVGCTTAQPEPTSTPLPPTKPPPPTDTSVPPTQALNPYAEEVLLAFADVVNNQEYEEAKTFFSEDITFKTDYFTYEASGIQGWLDEAKQYEDFYKFSEFVIEGDSVEFKWFFRTSDSKEMCDGIATMEEDKILYLEITACKDI